MPVSLRYYRCMTVRKTLVVPDCSCGPEHSVLNEWQPRCWQDGTADQTKEEMAFYGLIYDGYKIIFVSPKLECVYMSLQDLVPPPGFLPEAGTGKEVQPTVAAPLTVAMPPKVARKTKAKAILESEDEDDDDDEEEDEAIHHNKAKTLKKTKNTRV